MHVSVRLSRHNGITPVGGDLREALDLDLGPVSARAMETYLFTSLQVCLLAKALPHPIGHSPITYFQVPPVIQRQPHLLPLLHNLLSPEIDTFVPRTISHR